MKRFIQRNQQSGFTLIELMVVIAIIAILAAVVVTKIMSRPDQAKKAAAKQDIIAIENAMDLYKLDNGDYPTQAQGIKALVSKPTTPPIPTQWQSGGYLKSMPVDPWGRPYRYSNPGQHGTIDIYTYGANNQPNGTGTSATIGNWNLSKRG